MKKITRYDLISFFKNLDYRHYICAGVTLAFILINIFCFPYTFPRLGEVIRDFGLSIGYHYATAFQIENNIVPSVTALSKMPFTISDRVPPTWELFKEKWDLYWQTFADGQTVLDYISSFRTGALTFSYLFSMLVPLFVGIAILVGCQLNKQDNNYNVDSKPLKAFKKFSDKTYRPVKVWINGFIEFVRTNSFYLKLWAFIWLLGFNVISIVFEAFAFFFYFSVSLDVGNLYIQVYKLLLDLSVMFKFVPVPVWVIVGLIVFDKIRKKRGYDNLMHNELMNRGFINERGVFSFIVAPMRQGKTKFSVAMALSREVMYRDNAYEIILKCDLKFPYFPWINFENSIRKAMDNHSVFNLATCRRFVVSKMKKFYKHPIERYIFGYDFNRYGMEYDNKKYIETLESVLLDYAQAYFIFIVQSSLIVSNYSIRVDDLIEYIGNFPARHADFFRTDSRYVDALSRHSKILDYDALRMGKKVAGESKFAFEFGVIDITEIAKERLNQNESDGIKRDSKDANQKNDGFDSWVKMCGHNATVDFKCFVNIYCDDQREQNLPASLREVGEILRIEDSEKDYLAMPGFFVEELIYSISHKITEYLHKKVRYNQGGNTLLYYVLHTIGAKIENYYNRIYNIFGYEVLNVSVQDGAQDNDKKMHKFYISNKKDLSNRYSTDCLSDLLAVRALRATWGLDDSPSFPNNKATVEDFKKMNSYFFNAAIKELDKKKPENKKEPPYNLERLREFIS